MFLRNDIHVQATLPFIRDLTLEKDLINVMSAAKELHHLGGSKYTNEYTLEMNVIRVMPAIRDLQHQASL